MSVIIGVTARLTSFCGLIVSLCPALSHEKAANGGASAVRRASDENALSFRPPAATHPSCVSSSPNRASAKNTVTNTNFHEGPLLLTRKKRAFGALVPLVPLGHFPVPPLSARRARRSFGRCSSLLAQYHPRNTLLLVPVPPVPPLLVPPLQPRRDGASATFNTAPRRCCVVPFLGRGLVAPVVGIHTPDKIVFYIILS